MIEKEEEINFKIVNELRGTENLKFLTKKDIFSNGKRYYSKAHVDSNQEALDKWGSVVDSESFWKDLEHYYIYESF